MNAVADIKALDVIKYRQLRPISCSEEHMMHPLILQVGEETFRQRIAVGRLSDVHARLHLGLR